MLRIKFFGIIIALSIYVQAMDEQYLHAIEMYAQQNNYEQAIIHAQHACASITLQTPISFLFSLANCCVALGQAEMAITLFDKILTKQPDNISALYNKAYTLKMAERLDEAITLYGQILERDPGYEQAHMGLAFSHFMTGNLSATWQENEYTLKKQKLNAETLRSLLQTNNLVEKTILLCSQGGLGDSIQYIRYAQLLKEQGARIIVCIQKPLIPLLSNCPYIDELISTGSKYPAHDAFAGLMTLPALLNLNTENLTGTVPYLFSDPTLIEQWKQQLVHDTNFKIGICWHVSSFNDSSRHYVA
jgi:tetratricopeptide (TPR) repeat protein